MTEQIIEYVPKTMNIVLGVTRYISFFVRGVSDRRDQWITAGFEIPELGFSYTYKVHVSPMGNVETSAAIPIHPFIEKFKPGTYTGYIVLGDARAPVTVNIGLPKTYPVGIKSVEINVPKTEYCLGEEVPVTVNIYLTRTADSAYPVHVEITYTDPWGLKHIIRREDTHTMPGTNMLIYKFTLKPDTTGIYIIDAYAKIGLSEGHGRKTIRVVPAPTPPEKEYVPEKEEYVPVVTPEEVVPTEAPEEEAVPEEEAIIVKPPEEKPSIPSWIIPLVALGIGYLLGSEQKYILAREK